MNLGIVIHELTLDDDGNISIKAFVVRPRFDSDAFYRDHTPEERTKAQTQHDARQLMYLRLHLGHAELDQAYIE